MYSYLNLGTASSANNGAGAVDCDSRRAVGPVTTTAVVVYKGY